MSATAAQLLRIEIDGASATADQLRAAAFGSFGHFTAMQVRARRARGLQHHVARLDAANRELFGVGLDEQVVRSHIRHALGEDIADASVRVHLYEGGDQPSLMVTVRPAGAMPPAPWRLRSVPYQRPVAHIKHTADFGQRYYQRPAPPRALHAAPPTRPHAIISPSHL